MAPLNSLLPKSEIDAFALNQSTMRALAKAQEDWRLARVRLNVIEGGLDQALEHYRAQSSPDLVAVEIGPGANDLPEAVGHLASFCQPHTNAIVLGASNDVRLYRRLMELGVTDYLVAPFDDHELIGSFARALDTGPSSKKSVGVIGAKGGVGGTTIAQLLSQMAGREAGQEVFLIDLMGAAGTSGIAFGLEPKRSLDEILASVLEGKFDAEMLRRLAFEVDPQLQILPGGRGRLLPEQYDTASVETLIDEAGHLASVVVLDLPSGWHGIAREAAALCDEVVVVLNPMLGAVRNARMLMDDLRARRGHSAPCHVLVNMQGAYGRAELPISAIAEALEVKDVHSLPFAPDLIAFAETNGTPLPQDKQTEKVLRHLRPLSQKITQGLARTSSAGVKASTAATRKLVDNVKHLLGARRASA